MRFKYTKRFEADPDPVMIPADIDRMVKLEDKVMKGVALAKNTAETHPTIKRDSIYLVKALHDHYTLFQYSNPRGTLFITIYII